MMRRGLGLALLLALAPQADAARLTGRVVDRAGVGLEFANVRAPQHKRGAVTDAEGRFELDLPEGATAIEVSQLGYQLLRLSVAVADGIAPLRFTLHEEPVPVAEVHVQASSFGRTGQGEGAVVRRSDVYTTPGGAADLFQSLRALPGINAPTEGAALFVRGGDPSETVIRLDGADIGHPYHYEGASGGLFSIMDTYLLQSAFFSSGGFGARYGGGMSGVLDIETRDPLNERSVSMGAHMAGASLASTWSIIPDKLAGIVSVARGDPRMLFKLYGSASEFEQTPTSWNGIGKLIHRYSPSGRVSLLTLQSAERIRVVSQQLSVQDTYASRVHNQFWALHLTDVAAGRVAVKANLTTQRFRDDWSFSDFGQRGIERQSIASLDFVWPVSERHESSFGAGWRHRTFDRDGLTAADSTDLAPGADTRIAAVRGSADEPWAHAEHKMRVVGSLYATLGGRIERVLTVDRWVFDPRGALALRMGDHQTLRVATGRYHQPPQLARLDARYGNPRLEPSYADHVIAGYEWASDFGTVRLEAYRKDYRRLARQDDATWWAADGFGYARGVDVLVQGTHGWLDGWVSYGYLDAKRREEDDPRELTARYGPRHAVTLVQRYQVTPRFHVGARYSHSTGRPYTPVVGATFDAGESRWRPVLGENQSGRMPDYHRVDLRLMRLFSLPQTGHVRASNVCVMYAEALNVLGIRNVLDYWYNEDYSERRDIDSYFSRRMIVAGVALSW